MIKLSQKKPCFGTKTKKAPFWVIALRLIKGKSLCGSFSLYSVYCFDCIQFGKQYEMCDLRDKNKGEK
jgi:hypothetical protein